MVTVPGIVWRYGPILRGVLLGVSVGAVLGALSWLDSGFLLSGVIVFVVLSVFYGWWMARRMARHWPSATQLSGSERERVARAARCGERPSMTLGSGLRSPITATACTRPPKRYGGSGG